MTAPLLPVLPFIEGETLTGYVSRSAKLFETTPRDFCSDLRMRWPYLCSSHDYQIERLAWLIGKKPEDLKTFASGKVRTGRFRFGRTLATSGALCRTATRFCPRCVREALLATGQHGIFQKLEWSLMSLHSCHLHNCQLLALPTRQHTHSAYDFVSRVMDRFDLVELDRKSIGTVSPFPFEDYLRERIWHGPQDDWLIELDLSQVQRLCMNLGAALEGLEGKSMKVLSGKKERRLCQLGFEYLEAGPDGLRSALELLRKQSKTVRPYFSSDMGQLYRWLKEYFRDPALMQIIDVASAHIFETYPIPTGKEVFGRVAPEQRLLTMDEARKRSGFGVAFLKKLLGHINGVDEAEALLRTDVHVDELAEVKTFWDSLIKLKDAVWILGLSRSQIKSLQSKGVLDVIKVSSSLRYVANGQVAALMKKLRALPPTLSDKSVLPLREFCHLKQVSMVQIIELWAQGKLDGSLCRGEGIGLQALEVDSELLSQATFVDLIGDQPADETARYLRINVLAIRRLRDSGYLDEISRRNPDTNHLKRYITKESISAFEQEYITLGQFAAQQGTRAMHLARRLDREGVMPVTCSAGPVRVYAISALKDCLPYRET